jgi:hypothetical protein
MTKPAIFLFLRNRQQWTIADNNDHLSESHLKIGKAAAWSLLARVYCFRPLNFETFSGIKTGISDLANWQGHD